MATPENGSTTGNNGVVKPIGGVEIHSVFDGRQYIPRPEEEIKRLLKSQAGQPQKPTGGVEGAIFNGTEYIPIE